MQQEQDNKTRAVVAMVVVGCLLTFGVLATPGAEAAREEWSIGVGVACQASGGGTGGFGEYCTVSGHRDDGTGGD